jgi:hypothetical protein
MEPREDLVAQPRTGGFFISYAAAGVLFPLAVVTLGLAIADHTAIGHLDDKLEFLSSRVIDGTVVARLVDHDVLMADRLRVVDDRLKTLETFAGSSTQDRAALHFELSSLRDYLKYMGRNPPDGTEHAVPDPPGGHR